MTEDNGMDLPDDAEHDLFLYYLRKVGETAEGRAVIWGILDMTGLYGISTDKDYHMFSEGRRSVGTELLASINAADKALFVTMQLEHLGEDDE